MIDPSDMLDTDAGATAAVALAAAEPTALEPDEGRFFVVNHPFTGVRLIDLAAERDKYRETPARKTGQVTLTDAPSFVTYLEKHGETGTEVWADANTFQVVAVIDAHDTGTPGWGEHRATLRVRKTKAWQAWAELDGKLVDQATFAEHIEDRLPDIVRPSGADMLELAQTIEATIGVRFESSRLLSSGERQLEYREQVDAKAGRAGRLEIPRDFDLGLAPFEGADNYKVTARFRYRINDGALRLGYKLDRPADVLRGAFVDVAADIEAGVDAPVFNGTPTRS